MERERKVPGMALRLAKEWNRIMGADKSRNVDFPHHNNVTTCQRESTHLEKAPIAPAY